MASQREIVLCCLSVPANANSGGKVQGGTVMKWMDEAGYACAAAWSGPYCVTAFVGEIDFERPIAIGSLVQVHARVLHTGRSSMQVCVTVSSADPKVGQYAMTTRSFMVFVAVGSDGRGPCQCRRSWLIGQRTRNWPSMPAVCICNAIAKWPARHCRARGTAERLPALRRLWQRR